MVYGHGEPCIGMLLIYLQVTMKRIEGQGRQDDELSACRSGKYNR